MFTQGKAAQKGGYAADSIILDALAALPKNFTDTESVADYGLSPAVSRPRQLERVLETLSAGRLSHAVEHWRLACVADSLRSAADTAEDEAFMLQTELRKAHGMLQANCPHT